MTLRPARDEDGATVTHPDLGSLVLTRPVRPDRAGLPAPGRRSDAAGTGGAP